MLKHYLRVGLEKGRASKAFVAHVTRKLLLPVSSHVKGEARFQRKTAFANGTHDVLSSIFDAAPRRQMRL